MLQGPESMGMRTLGKMKQAGKGFEISGKRDPILPMAYMLLSLSKKLNKQGVLIGKGVGGVGKCFEKK